jgi:hypothetical protein
MESRGFGRLLKRYLDNRVSGPERAAIEAWLNEDKIAGDRGFTWQKEDEDLLFREITARIEKGEKGKSGPRNGHWLKVAATVLLLSGSYVMTHWLEDTVTVDQSTADRDKGRE